MYRKNFILLLIVLMLNISCSDKAWTKKMYLKKANKSIEIVTVQKAREMAGVKKVKFLDVRGIMISKDGKKTFNERRIDGYIKDSLHIPRGLIEVRGSLFNKKQTYIIYCKKGSRSALAAKTLKEMGFNAYNMKGGLIAWKKAGFPFVK